MISESSKIRLDDVLKQALNTPPPPKKKQAKKTKKNKK